MDFDADSAMGGCLILLGVLMFLVFYCGAVACMVKYLFF